MAMGDLQAVIDQQQAEIAQLNQQNNELRLQLSRSRSSSTTSGKKRPAPVGWEVIIYALHGIDDKDRVLSTLEAMKSPEEFIQLNLEGKKNFVEMIGLTDWEDAITKQIGEVLKQPTIPSPSDMSWNDVDRILVDGLPDSISLDPCLPCVELTSAIKEMLRIVSRYFLNSSEMDAILRVFVLLALAIDGQQDVKVSMQHSLTYHKTFTDFYIFVKAGKIPRFFIEVKKPTENVRLGRPDKPTAQALRKAQILLCECKEGYQLEWLPFLLTNSETWSFGVAEKCQGSMIKLKEIYDIYFPTEMKKYEEVVKIVGLMKTMIEGKWPFPSSSSSS